MLNDLYAIKPICSDNEKNVYTSDGSDDDQIMKNSDDHKATKFGGSATPSTLSSDYACNGNTYGYKGATENHSDDPMVASYTHNSGNDMKYVQVAECQSLNAEIQSGARAILQLQCNTDIQPTHQPIYELTLRNQDPYPYVSFSFANTSKSYTADSDTKTTLSTDYVQETNLI